MIVFCGYANRDLTVSVPALPGVGSRVQATDVRDSDGGMGANAAVAAARVGADARFAGAVGADARSAAFLLALAEDGVDVALTVRTATLTTAVVLLTPDGERAIISQDDALDAALVGELYAAAAAEGADWLYLDGYRFPAAHSVLAGRPGPRVVVDLDGCADPPAARAALSLADHAVIGRALATELLGGSEALAGAARAHRVHLLVTDGARGWTLFEPDGGRLTGAALPVTAVDTTGAGDCFVGAYCAELDLGAEPAAAARFASVAAGLSCTRAGARDGLPDRAAVLAQIGQLPAH
ncbi:MAG TPA: carbohydrate kinase family protein [Pseudonocardia sp.]|nr:carbohydrate kinase family protein [Pseudonocardia sp.]